jgi:hypothetical protein
MPPLKENGCACYQFNKDPRLNLERVIDALVQQNKICMDSGIINRLRSAYNPEQQRLNKKAFHPIFPALFYGQQICEKCDPAVCTLLEKFNKSGNQGPAGYARPEEEAFEDLQDI